MRRSTFRRSRTQGPGQSRQNVDGDDLPQGTARRVQPRSGKRRRCGESLRHAFSRSYKRGRLPHGSDHHDPPIGHRNAPRDRASSIQANSHSLTHGEFFLTEKAFDTGRNHARIHAVRYRDCTIDAPPKPVTRFFIHTSNAAVLMHPHRMMPGRHIDIGPPHAYHRPPTRTHGAKETPIVRRPPITDTAC